MDDILRFKMIVLGEGAVTMQIYFHNVFLVPNWTNLSLSKSVKMFIVNAPTCR